MCCRFHTATSHCSDRCDVYVYALAFAATLSAAFLGENVTRCMSEQTALALWRCRAAFTVTGNRSRDQVNPLTLLPVSHLTADDVKKCYK